MEKIVGFTFLRNALRYDYPFRESILSLGALADAIVVAVGKSEDNTLSEVRALEALLPCPLYIVETIWDESKRSSGIVLSEQTNIALKQARELFPNAWAFYLQGDEVLLESECAEIREDLARAKNSGAEAVRFRYLHFWLRPDRIAVGKRWYPQEIRALRTESRLESYGDAQSFRGGEKFFDSNAHIFHYGHVREASAYAEKKRDFHRWWHPDREIPGLLAKGESHDAAEHCIPYLGPYPRAMRERLQRLFGAWRPPLCEELFIYGDPGGFSQSLRESIQAKKIHWLNSPDSLAALPTESCVLLKRPSFLFSLRTRFRFRSQVPPAMGSPNARPWTNDFLATLKLSERNIACN